MRKKCRDNRGVTLVELMVSLAILAIVIGGLMGFFLFSNQNYQKQSSEASLQNEAQLIMNRLENMIVNATNGVACSSDKSELYLYNRVSASGGTDNYVITKIYQANVDGKKKLVFQKYNFVPGATGGTTPSGNQEVISDYMKDFSCDYDKDTGVVEIKLEMEERKKTYNTSNQFLLRNRTVKEDSTNANDHFGTE